MNQLIVTITHSNYLLRSSGTEKFVRTVSKLIMNNYDHHLNFFSIKSDKSIGVNYDDKFVGIFRYKDISKIISYYGSLNNSMINSIQIHHLLYWDIEIVKNLLLELQIPIYIFVHDYYFICSRLNLINSDMEYCGKECPSEEKCTNCTYMNSGIKHYAAYSTFFARIDGLIQKIIVPSKCVYDIFVSSYPEFVSRIVIRPHLIFNGKQNYEEVSKLRIAYAGNQSNIKGYVQWMQFVNYITERKVDNVELYYFGVGKDNNTNVKNVYVSSAEQGDDAMAQAIKKYNINCAFLFSQCPETYSYVYYELSSCGVYIITSSVSGNIANEVLENKNGIVFSSVEGFIDWLKEYSSVLKNINEYRINGRFRPASCIANDDYSFVDSHNSIVSETKCMKKQRPNSIKTFLYRFKYRKKIF